MTNAFKLNEDANIYNLIKDLNKKGNNWWTRLREDKDIYIDIRKDDTINIYHNGGSILKIHSAQSAKINYAYLPAGENNTYATCDIKNDKIDLKNKIEISLDDLNTEKITQIKKIIENYYPNDSEKGIQGAYATVWKKDEGKDQKGKLEKFGFFIDTELQYSKNGRIDLIYLYYENPEKPKLYFVELKTKGDDRLWNNTCNSTESKENICEQLEKYKEFINTSESVIIDYYKTLYKIKKDLNLIPDDAKGINIEKLKIEHKPILLIGDATFNFIYKDGKCKNKEKELSEEMKNLKNRIEAQDCACMIICRGRGTHTLNFHSKSSGNVFMINPPKNNEEK